MACAGGANARCLDCGSAASSNSVFVLTSATVCVVCVCKDPRRDDVAEIETADGAVVTLTLGAVPDRAVTPLGCFLSVVIACSIVSIACCNN